MVDKRAEQPDNTFPETLKIAKGFSNARYENCYWRLEPGFSVSSRPWRSRRYSR
jgi:hypothetical protein